jgi:hypothetical protein
MFSESVQAPSLWSARYNRREVATAVTLLYKPQIEPCGLGEQEALTYC